MPPRVQLAPQPLGFPVPQSVPGAFTPQELALALLPAQQGLPSNTRMPHPHKDITTPLGSPVASSSAWPCVAQALPQPVLPDALGCVSSPLHPVWALWVRLLLTSTLAFALGAQRLCGHPQLLPSMGFPIVSELAEICV